MAPFSFVEAPKKAQEFNSQAYGFSRNEFIASKIKEGALSLHSHISFIPLSLFPFLYLGDGIEAKGEEER